MYLQQTRATWHATNGPAAARRAEHAWYLRGTGRPPGRNHHVMNVLDARTAAVGSRAAGGGPTTPRTHVEKRANGRSVRSVRSVEAER